MFTLKWTLPQSMLILASAGALFTGCPLFQPSPADLNYQFQRLWPVLQQPWYFNRPTAVDVDRDGNVYVGDQGAKKVLKFNADGRFLTQFGDWDLDWYAGPDDIATDAEGNVYVLVIRDNYVAKYSPNGDFLVQWDAGAGAAQGIAVGETGFVYVTDNFNDRVHVFTLNGEYVNAWGAAGSLPGQFDAPMGIAADEWGDVYVADSGNDRIQKFTANGEFLLEFGAEGSWDESLHAPTDLAAAAGRVYAVDEAAFKVLQFNSDGEFLRVLDDDAEGVIRFINPDAVSVGRDGLLYVAYEAQRGVQKFTADGQYLARWASYGNRPGVFKEPECIAIGPSGTVYVTETPNIDKRFFGRIQAFSPDGRFLREWWPPKDSPDDFFEIHGIAVDAQGRIYVSDKKSRRIYKFNSNGHLLDEWLEIGAEPGEFVEPFGLAIDNAGHIYFFDRNRSRIIKLSLDGEFVRQWGASGSEPGDFSSETNFVAVDNGPPTAVYVADAGNHRVQKFTADGEFLLMWGSRGDGAGQFKEPKGIAVDNGGYVFVSEGDITVSSGGRVEQQHRIQKFTKEGVFVGMLENVGSGPGEFFRPRGLAVDGAGGLFICDRDNHRIQKLVPKGSQTNHKAVIVAGGGPFPGNNLWDTTQMCANFAYRAVLHQGFTKDTIYYLSADTDLDLDNNGVADDVDADATIANLRAALTSWGPSALDGLPTGAATAYLVDHGGENTFRMSGTETFSSSELSGWLDTLQYGLQGTLTVVYDACESGSFLETLTAPASSAGKRVVITSTSPGENAYFVTSGTVSFSNYFWTEVFNGATVGDAFTTSADALSLVYSLQHPLLDDDGDGLGNTPGVAAATYVGNGAPQYWEGPSIQQVSPEQSVDGMVEASIWADPVIDDDGVERVWAVIYPPSFEQGPSNSPVSGLPSVDLVRAQGNRYEGTAQGLTTAGLYTVLIYARDTEGNTSPPSRTSVTVDNPLTRKALIVAGDLWTVRYGPLRNVWPPVRTKRCGTKATVKRIFTT